MHKLIKISTTLALLTLLITPTHDVFATLQDEIGMVAGTAGNKVKEFHKNRDQILFEKTSDVQHRMNRIRGDLHDPKIEDTRIAEIEAEFATLRQEFADILLIAEVKSDLLAEIARIDEAAQNLVKTARESDDAGLRDRAFEVKSKVSNLRQDVPGFGTLEQLGNAKAQLDEHIAEVLALQKAFGSSSSNDNDDAPAAAAAAAANDNT